MFGEGLNVRLAISEGDTATLSGQMSITLNKRFGQLLQAERPHLLTKSAPRQRMSVRACLLTLPTKHCFPENERGVLWTRDEG
jgi:hypothetical protein